MQSQTKTPMFMHQYQRLFELGLPEAVFVYYRLCRHDIKFIEKVTTRKKEREVILATISQSFH